jgi:glutaredoxin
MKRKLTLYSRKDCCLCEEMKAVIGEVALKISLDIEEIDVDSSPALQEKYGNEVPVLFIDGRKAFKYRLTPRELSIRMRSDSKSRSLLNGFGSKGRGR